MKRVKALMFMLLVIAIPAGAQMQTQERIVLFPSSDRKEPVKIEPGRSFEQEVTFDHKSYPVRRTLRVVGAVAMPGKFAPRGEEYFRQQEYLIDDNLDSVNTYKDRYSLYFKGEGDAFERHAFNRITGIAPGIRDVTLEIAYKRNGLNVAPEGDFGVELQIYSRKTGRHPDDIYDRADSVVRIPIPEGSGNFRVLKKSITLPTETAAILIRTGGTNFTGECWLEAPLLYAGGEDLFRSPFIHNEKRADDHNYWVGVNLATRSWPRWKLEFRGKTLFEGNIFDRASDIADFHIPLPAGISGAGKLKLTLLKEPNRAAYAYDLRSVQLLEESARDFEIVSVPRFVTVGDTTAILVETNRSGVSLTVSSSSPDIGIIDKNIVLENTGLHTILFTALRPAVRVKISILDREATVEQFVVKDKDNVYLSSGDEIYIDKEYGVYDQFFKWYFRNRVGNQYHFRPSYQWSGVRITDENVIGHYTDILNKMRVPYAWQVEGRTLASTRINPSIESLNSPMFRGKQAHENDGGYYYWQHFLYNGLHSDMAARTRPYGGIFAKHRPIYTDHGVFIHYDPYGVGNMADGAAKLIANLSYSRGESTRHTGPSTMFRYLYMAGYEWLGAEQMYGPEDIIMSALRGASRAYHKKEFGSLHAVQWGSKPFTDPKHSLRFFLSLAVAYIHGSSHINTEEGLWTDEYANDRYTQAGEEHMYAQHTILDYIETHSRKGELSTGIAVIQGRNDGWKSFGRSSLWSQKGEKWKFNKATESFDLLKVFYPGNNVDYCSTDGLFTSTPYGPVDILPIEASCDVLNRYKALIFLGWNTFDNVDFIRLKKFVEQGGTLLLSAAHLNSELNPDIPPRFPEDDAVIQALLGMDYKTYVKRTVIRLGKGSVIFYPQNVYPADGVIRTGYIRDMENIASDIVACETVNGWIKPSPNIDFSVWESADFRTLYLLSVDWKSDRSVHSARFVINDKEFTLDVPLYHIVTIRCSGNIAAVMGSVTSDVLGIEQTDGKRIVTCQTAGADKLTIFDGITGYRKTIDVFTAGIHRIEVVE